MKKLILIILIIPLFAQAQIIATIAGNGVQAYAGDGGPASAAEIYEPISITTDRTGNYYVIDGGSCVVRKVNTAGIISDFAGHSVCLNDPAGAMSGDGGPASAAHLNSPSGIAIDGTGKLYIADHLNYRVRVVGADGIITTFAGTGITGGAIGDGGPATAAAVEPQDVAVDVAGNVYISDKIQNGIRKVNAATGIITTIAGTGVAGASGDGGPATAATLDPSGITLDILGNIYIINGTANVRKIDAVTGIIITIAGTGAIGHSGDGSPATAATLNKPEDLAADTLGNLYIADAFNNVVRKVSTTGIITAYAGNYTGGYGGDGGLAVAAKLSIPLAVAVDSRNNLLIADAANQRVRKVSNAIEAVNTPMLVSYFTVYPNPAAELLNISATGKKITTITITDILGQTVYAQEYHAEQVQIPVSSLPSGVYLVKINGVEIHRFIKQ